VLKSRTISYCLLSSSMIATAAHGQTAPGGSTAAQPVPGEIIVTAQKRAERLNDVPLSITAASGAQLARQGVVKPADLEKVVPGFTYQPSSYGTPVFTIRGIGFFENSLAVAPAVSVYVDQVPLPYSQMTQGASLDLERVEALKGPQGTLFGQNSTGGAINYVAAKPTRDFHTGLDLGYGRFNAFDAQGFISGPLTDTMQARFAFRSEQHGDWQTSETRDASLGHRDFLTGRALLDWQPSDTIKFELNANGWRDHSDTQAAQFVEYSPTNPDGYKDQEPVLSAYKPAPNSDRVADWDPNTSLRRHDYFYQISLRGDWQINDAITLSSITAYSDLKVHAPSDTDGTAYNNFLLTIRGRIHSFSQELRLSGNAFDDKLKWMVGGNYGHDRTADDQRGDYTASNSGVGPFRYNAFINSNHQVIDTKAAFGSLDYKLTRQVSLQGSVRYTRADDDFTGCLRDAGDGALSAAFGALSSELSGSPTVIPPGACVTLGPDGKPVPIVRSSLNQNNVSWRGGISWKPDQNALLYANVTKGYKAGSYPTIPGLNPEQFQPVTQESLLAYEAGFKLTMLDRTLNLDGAAFYYKYDNKQILGYINTGVPFGNLPGLVSIPRSSVRGGELSATWHPVRPLTIRAGATYVDSRVDKHFLTPDPFSNLIDIKGESFPNTPKWQLTGDVEYDFPLSDRLNAYVGASGKYRSGSVAAFGDNPEFRLPGYALLDLRAGIETADHRWHIDIWGRNITDKFYLIHVSHVVDTVARVTGMPATYGVTVGFKY